MLKKFLLRIILPMGRAGVACLIVQTFYKVVSRGLAPAVVDVIV